jgi:hypothetical protein
MVESRVKTEFKVRKLEFNMGLNDPVDMRCGGPASLAFWVYSSLSEEHLQCIAEDTEVQKIVRQHGGDGSFNIANSVWTEKFCHTENEVKENLFKLAKQF